MGAQSKTTYTQGILPTWYTNYAQDIIANQQAVANRPYIAYEGPRLADVTAAQKVGQAMQLGAAQSYEPALDLATMGTAGALGNSVLGTVAGDLANASQDRSTSASGSGFGRANSIAAGAADAQGLNAAKPYLQQAVGFDLQGRAQPYIDVSSEYATSSANPWGVSMAEPFMRNASGTSVEGIDAYMNPFTRNVLEGYNAMAASRLAELLPQLEGRYIGSGQFSGRGANGSFVPTGLNTESLRALRDINTQTGQQQMEALQAAYAQAMGARQADLGRQFQIGSTLGNLGQQQQQLIGQAGQQLGTLAQLQGNLGQAQQQAYLTAGGTLGNLGVAQQNAIAEQARLAAQTAQQQGQLTQNQQALELQAAQQKLDAAKLDAANQLAASGQLASIANQTQQQGLTGAQAVQAVGGQQQAFNQANLDLAYQQFQNQLNYPQQQINQSVQTLAGVQSGVPQAQISYESTKMPSTSTLQTIGGLALTGAGLAAK